MAETPEASPLPPRNAGAFPAVGSAFDSGDAPREPLLLHMRPIACLLTCHHLPLVRTVPFAG